jgi:predicted nucleotide-binding protein (sugar kinase/HSP70/actin superfamily)
MVIGIPRALIYWKRPHFWGEFFNKLGFRVLLSPETNKEIVEMGVKKADPETCFSNKVYWGHLLWLDQKCNFIFIPRLKTNAEKLEYCPKFFGLPDLAKILVKTPILTETFDSKKRAFERNLEMLGRKLDRNAKEVKEAFSFALLKEKTQMEKEKQMFLKRVASDKPKIILISHPYNLYDDYVNLRMTQKLKKLGVEPLFINEISKSGTHPNDSEFVSKVDFHWEFAKEMVEKVLEIFKYNIAGGIEVSSFQCGCDGVIKEFIEEEFRLRKIPFLYIILDEHTGEAGLQTRLEAFIDTLQ